MWSAPQAASRSAASPMAVDASAAFETPTVVSRSISDASKAADSAADGPFVAALGTGGISARLCRARSTASGGALGSDASNWHARRRTLKHGSLAARPQSRSKTEMVGNGVSAPSCADVQNSMQASTRHSLDGSLAASLAIRYAADGVVSARVSAERYRAMRSVVVGGACSSISRRRAARAN